MDSCEFGGGDCPDVLFDATILTHSDDVNLSALEFDGAVRGREERVVLAHTDVRSREEFGPALPNDY